MAAAAIEREYITPPAIARQLGCRPETVVGWIRSGELPGLDLSRRGSAKPRYRVAVADLERFLRGRAVVQDAPPEMPRRPAKRGRWY